MSRPGVFSIRDFRLIWVAYSVSECGTAITIFALPWVAINQLRATAFEVGLIMFFQFLAVPIIGLQAGVWIDRRMRRGILISADLGRAVLLASIPVAYVLQMMTLAQLYVVAFLGGALSLLFGVAHQSYIPSLVAKHQLIDANSKLQGSQGVAEVSGPAVTGLLIAFITAPLTILIDSFTFLLSACAILQIGSKEMTYADKTPSLRFGIREGFRFILKNPVMRALAMRSAMFNFFETMLTSMFTFLLISQLSLPSSIVGLIFSLAGVGAIFGTLLAKRVVRRVGYGDGLLGATVVAGGAGLLIPLAQHGWLTAISAIGFAIASMSVVVYNICAVSLRQLMCPDHLLGRMNGTMRFLVWGTVPIGALSGGILAQAVGVRNLLWIAAIGQIVAIVPLYLSPLRKLTFDISASTMADTPYNGSL